jgi:archaellum component FlaC
MLDHLKKFFKPEEEKVEMTTETTVEASQGSMPEVEAMAAELSELKASFAQVTEALASTKAELEGAKAALAAVAEEKAQAEAAAKAEKLAQRRAAVEANIGTDKADAFMDATKELNDTAFAAICSAMAGTAKAEAESELFKEVGVETKAEATAEPKVTHFKQFIKGKK